MELMTIFTKTAKGVTQVNQKTQSLPRDLMKILKQVDGKSSVEALSQKTDIPIPALEKALGTLVKEGYIKTFESRSEPANNFAAEADQTDGFNFTAPDRTAETSTPMEIITGEVMAELDDETILTAAREKAQAEARARAEREAQLRARLEVEVRARREVEARALEEAKRTAIAEEKERTELELKLAKEQTKRAVLANTHDRLTTEQMQREEESQPPAAARLEMETEVQALAMARAIAKPQEEAQHLLEQHPATEQKKLLKMEEDANRHAEGEARHLPVEKEPGVQGEIQAHLPTIAEEKARVETEARRMAEAQAELTAPLKAEEEGRRTSEAQMRQEADARSRARLEARAREEAEQRARLQAELDAIRAGEKEGEAQLDAERRAREEAEKRAQLQGKAREIASRAVLEQVAEKQRIIREAKKRLLQERQAREVAEAKFRADEEAEERQRQAQIARLKELNERAEQAKVEKEKAAATVSKKNKIRAERHIGRWVAMTIVAMLAIAVGLSYVMPLDPLNKRLENALSGWLHERVSISGLRIDLFPSPHLKFEAIALGETLSARAGNGRIYLDASALFDDRYLIDKIELTQIAIQTESLPRLTQWTETAGRPVNIAIGRIILHSVKLDVKGTTVDVFDAELRFDNAGKLVQMEAKTIEPKWSLSTALDQSIAANAGSWAVDFNAHNINLPGTPLAIESATAKGVINGQQLNLTSINANLMGGKASGTLWVDWKNGLAFTADLDLKRINLTDFVKAFTRDVSIAGRMEGHFSISGEGAHIGTLFDKPRIKGTFQATDGLIGNIDLVRALRAPDSGARGGQTKFSELSAQLYAEGGTLQYEKIKLVNGFMQANGILTIASNSGLTGSVNVEIRSSVAQERGSFVFSGSVSRPILKRGG